MGRAPCCDKANVKKGPWSPEEDATLKSYIERHGTGGNWITLPQKIGLKRCGKSCRLRWLNYLRPNIKHGGFSEEEDKIICSLYVTMGSRWSIIAAQLPGRTDNDIKNYWNTRLKKKLLGKQRKERQAAARDKLGHTCTSTTTTTTTTTSSSSSPHQLLDTNCYGTNYGNMMSSTCAHVMDQQISSWPYADEPMANNSQSMPPIQSRSVAVDQLIRGQLIPPDHAPMEKLTTMMTKQLGDRQDQYYSYDVQGDDDQLLLNNNYPDRDDHYYSMSTLNSNLDNLMISLQYLMPEDHDHHLISTSANDYISPQLGNEMVASSSSAQLEWDHEFAAGSGGYDTTQLVPPGVDMMMLSRVDGDMGATSFPQEIMEERRLMLLRNNIDVMVGRPMDKYHLSCSLDFEHGIGEAAAIISTAEDHEHNLPSSCMSLPMTAGDDDHHHHHPPPI